MIIGVNVRRLTPLLMGIAACADGIPTETRASGPGFTVVSGPGRTDSVLAIPGTFRIQLRDASGSVQPGATVVMRSLMRGTVRTMYLDTLTTLFDSVATTTDANGAFLLTPRYGRLAGAAGLILSAPAISMVDTLEFTVLPGAVSRVAIVPHDTAVRLGREVRLTIAVRDRYGNVRTEVPTVQAGPGIRLESGGRVTGLAYGRSMVAAKFGALADTGSVTVVPPGRLAGFHGSSLFHVFVVNTDGSGADPFLRQHGWSGGSTRWSRDGTRVLVSAAPFWTGSYRLYEITVADRSERLVWAPPQGTNQGWPDYTRDGEWIYFLHVVGPHDYGTGGTGGVWRVRPDGSSPQQVVPPPSVGPGWMSPTVSPTGDRLAYVAADGTVFVRALDGGATSTITGLAATSVTWSPNDDRLLVAGRSGLFVVGADGSGRRRLRSGVIWGLDAAWSPDGKWVVWHSGGGIDLVQLEPELAVTLPFSYGVLRGGWGFAWTNQP